jgi:aminoglycoside phosphotransferase (APT) family kinase protein
VRSLETLLAEAALDDALTAPRLSRLLALAVSPAPLLHTLNRGPFTLLHGDAGFQNIAISLNGRERLWYDWQLAAAGPPALDVATYLHPWAYPDAQPPLSFGEMIDTYLAALARRGRVLAPELFARQLDAALIWRWLCQWAPLLGLYRARLKPEVRERLYHAFAQLHWPALERWGQSDNL